MPRHDLKTMARLDTGAAAHRLAGTVGSSHCLPPQAHRQSVTRSGGGMSSKPWMPLYIGDFTADTMHLSATEIGIYVQLLMHCWQHGTIPTNPRQLALISHCDTRLWHLHSKTVLQFFSTVDASTMQHKRVSTELQRCEEISNKRKAAALQMHSKSHAKVVHLHTQSQSQLHKKENMHSAGSEDWQPLPGLSVICEGSDQAKAWEAHLGKPLLFGKNGGRTVPSEWPPGWGRETKPRANMTMDELKADNEAKK